MKTYIFFDTNVLEIIKGKDYSKFLFSKRYYDIEEVINYFDIDSYVNLIIPQIVLDEMLKHYQEEFKSYSDEAKSNINGINNSFGSILNNKINFDLKYTKREYYEFIEKELEGYLKSKNIQVSDNPDNLDIVIKRAIDKKTPFVTCKKNKKEYKDAGFKDAVMWESIKKYSKEKKDIIILFTDDNDFDQEKLKNDVENEIKVIRSVDEIKQNLLETYKIKVNYFEARRFVLSSYFNDQIIEYLDKITKKHDVLLESKELIIDDKKLDILDVVNDDIPEYMGIYSDYPEKYLEMYGDVVNEDFLVISVPAQYMMYNTDNDNEKFIEFNLECLISKKEIVEINLPDNFLERMVDK